MSRRSLTHADAELSARVIDFARARLLEVDVDRKKRIDDTIDYFGVRHLGPGPDPCGEAWLDEADDSWRNARPAAPDGVAMCRRKLGAPIASKRSATCADRRPRRRR